MKILKMNVKKNKYYFCQKIPFIFYITHLYFDTIMCCKFLQKHIEFGNKVYV